jgi:PAS domain S-box-containing protein
MAKTSDMRKTKAELVKELQKLRRKVARLPQQVGEREQIGGEPTQDQLLLRTLLDNLPDHIYFKDTESRFIRISTSQADRFELSDPTEAMGKTDFDFFTEDHARPAYEDEQRIVRTGEPILGIEERETWPDRPDTWVLTSKMPLRDEAGNIVGTFGISSDITARKQAEMALGRRSAQLQTAAEVSRAVSSILDLDELIQTVVNLARERFDLYYAGLFLVDQTGEWTRDRTGRGEPGKWAVLRAGTGKAGRKMLKQGHKLEIGGESMIGWCVANRQARIALDVGEEAVRFDNPHLPETRSELALPLVSRGEAIGALTIQSTQAAAFSEEDIAVLQTMAGQIATAIENARLFEQAQARAEELAVLNELGQTLAACLSVEDVLDAVYRGARRLLDATNFYIALYDPDRDEVTFPLDATREEEDQFHALPADQGLTGYIIRNCTSLLIEENLPERLAEMGIEMVGKPALSWLGVPVMVGDRVLGVIGVQSYTTPRAYDEHDRELLTALASQMAIALQNARLFEEQQQASALLSGRVEELDCLSDIGRRVAESPPVPELLEWVAERIPPAMQYPDASVAAVEFGGQVYGSPEAVELPCQMVGGLRVGDQRVGQVYIAYTEEHDFLDEESALLGDIVRRLGGYIESRRLFEQTQAALREVEATHRRYLEQAWDVYLGSAEATSYETERPDAALLGDSVLPEVQQAMEQEETTVLTGDDHTALVAPIIVRGATIGALGIHAEDGTRQWTEDEIALVEAVAERMAQAAENLRLIEETQRRAAAEQLTGEIAARIRETLDMESILKTAAQEVRRALGLPELVIQLAAPPTSEGGDGVE